MITQILINYYHPSENEINVLVLTFGIFIDIGIYILAFENI